MERAKIFHIGGHEQSEHFPHNATFDYQWIPITYNAIKDEDDYKFFDKGNNSPHLFIIEHDAHNFSVPTVVEQLPAHQIFVSSDFVWNDEIGQMLSLKEARVIELDNFPWFFEYLLANFSFRPYGTAIHTEQLDIHDSFEGFIQKHGNVSTEFYGDFGEEFTQMISFKDARYFRGMVEFYPEISHGGESLEVFFRLYFTNLQTGEYVGSTDVTMERLRAGAVFIDLGEHNQYISISLFAKGVGQLFLGNIHLRFVPKDGSISQVGGRKIIDEKELNDEVFYYFNAGNMKPPLAVYFSGYRPAEGFEGRYMMGDLGCPFILFHDPRLEGGSFYLGSSKFEEKILRVIKDKLNLLGFNNQELVMSGMSMGTFGALYYGSMLEPGYIIVSKPLIHLGRVMLNERINRYGGFPTSYDVQLHHMKDLSRGLAMNFDDLFWNQFKKADFSKTNFVFAYMRQDDYDINAFAECFQYLREHYPNTKIIYKGFEGRHTDPSTAVEWFIKQYQSVLNERFDSKFEETRMKDIVFTSKRDHVILNFRADDGALISDMRIDRDLEITVNARMPQEVLVEDMKRDFIETMEENLTILYEDVVYHAVYRGESLVTSWGNDRIDGYFIFSESRNGEPLIINDHYIIDCVHFGQTIGSLQDALSLHGVRLIDRPETWEDTDISTTAITIHYAYGPAPSTKKGGRR